MLCVAAHTDCMKEAQTPSTSVFCERSGPKDELFDCAIENKSAFSREWIELREGHDYRCNTGPPDPFGLIASEA